MKKILTVFFLVVILCFAEGVSAQELTLVSEDELRIEDFSAEVGADGLSASFTLAGNAETGEACEMMPAAEEELTEGGARSCRSVRCSAVFPEAGLTDQDRILWFSLVSDGGLGGSFELPLASDPDISTSVWFGSDFQVTFLSDESVSLLRERGSLSGAFDDFLHVTKRNYVLRLEGVDTALNRIQFNFAEELEFVDADISSPEETISMSLNGAAVIGIGVAPYAAFPEMEIPGGAKTRIVEYIAKDVSGFNPWLLRSQGTAEAASLQLNIQGIRLHVGFLDADGYERIWVSDPIVRFLPVEFPIPVDSLVKEPSF